MPGRAVEDPDLKKTLVDVIFSWRSFVDGQVYKADIEIQYIDFSNSPGSAISVKKRIEAINSISAIQQQPESQIARSLNLAAFILALSFQSACESRLTSHLSHGTSVGEHLKPKPCVLMCCFSNILVNWMSHLLIVGVVFLSH